ncbi:MAG TPA: SRPBCC domain-containing protein [Pseudonocardiaceae bacterium]|nr:SRPBCC domain-containing protein [Pseudonocardiaceae bacterium]
MTQPDVLELSVHIKAAPETVFPYFTEATRYAQWMGSAATLEPVPGGIYRVSMSGGVEAVGRFLEIDPPHRVVFTWGWTHDMAVAPGSTRVVVTLAEEGGGTRVVLRHHGLPDDEQREHHCKGWTMYLDRLTTRATGGDPGPDPNA